jgi:Metal binding domain of Ada
MKINGLIEVIQTMVLQCLSIARSRLHAPPESEIFINVLNDMIEHSSIHPIQLRKLIRSGYVMLGGNVRLKIYGNLACASGQRMKKENRIFFKDEEEAIQAGFRPCGHCLRKKYLLWKRR